MKNTLIAIAVFVIVAVLGPDAVANVVEEDFLPSLYTLFKIIGIVAFLFVVFFLVVAFWIKER